MKQLSHIRELTTQERVSIHGGSAILTPELIAYLQSVSREYINQLITELLSPYPPPQFPNK